MTSRKNRPEVDKEPEVPYMVRIRCNICKQRKSLNSDTYEHMLKRFGMARSMLMGMTHGIESVLANRPIQKTIDRDETELAFAKVYVCDECRNDKMATIRTTLSLSKILNIGKEREN
jgi:hypothetical protein